MIRRLSSLVLAPLGAALLLHTACDGGDSAPAHPTDRLDYPTAVTADPSGRLVWVTSGNFDLAWRGAAVLALDVLENRFVPDLAFEIGNFPGALQFTSRDDRAHAAYIASREDRALYTVRFGGDDPARPTVACPGGTRTSPTSILHCPETDALKSAKLPSSGTHTLGDSPTAIAFAPRSNAQTPDLLFVGAAGDGQISTIALDAEGAPSLIGTYTLAKGLFDLTFDPATRRLFSTSKRSSTLATLDVAPRRDRLDPTALDPTNPWLTLAATTSLPATVNATDRARATALSADGRRLYLTYRSPDSLVIIDLSPDAEGTRGARVLNRIALSRQPNALVIRPIAPGRELIYVSCYADDRIEVIDPELGQVIQTIKVGRGPSGLTLVDRPDLGVTRLYVALFLANAVGVVELDPSSPYVHTEIAEIR